ncbi:RecX family transcriptional regulator [Paenibacillus chungangensis]|uniref:Regulatory protein RecX n=1 Tax=Paenibacillus chungangensis TaxID=696535 RepID=A0ABW3HQ21_9BACL
MREGGRLEDWIIVSVRPQKKDRKRYDIYIGEEEPVLTVHEDILIRYRLMKGGVLQDELLSEIKREDERFEAYRKAVAYLGAKPRTRKQLHQYLERKELANEHIEYALDRLEREGLVDDVQYAQLFAESRMRSSLKGRLMIRQELSMRGVSKSAALEAVSAISEEEEIAAANKLAEKKWRSLKGAEAERRRKLMGFLLRRGFPGHIVKEAIKSVNQGDDEQWEDDI